MCPVASTPFINTCLITCQVKLIYSEGPIGSVHSTSSRLKIDNTSVEKFLFDKDRQRIFNIPQAISHGWAKELVYPGGSLMEPQRSPLRDSPNRLAEAEALSKARPLIPTCANRDDLQILSPVTHPTLKVSPSTDAICNWVKDFKTSRCSKSSIWLKPFRTDKTSSTSPHFRSN